MAPPRHDSGTKFQWNDSGFGPQARDTGQKSELQHQSQSYSRGGPPESDRFHSFAVAISSAMPIIRADFWEGDATKHFSVKKRGFSVKRGEAIQWMKGLVRISTGKAIQWRGSGHSLNRRTLKLKSCCPHPLPQIMGIIFSQQESGGIAAQIVCTGGSWRICGVFLLGQVGWPG